MSHGHAKFPKTSPYLSKAESPRLPDEYQTDTNYTTGRVVNFNGSSYVSLLENNTGNEPAISPFYWKLLTQEQSSIITGDQAAAEFQIAFYPTSGPDVAPSAITSDSTGSNLTVPNVGTVGMLNSLSTQTLVSGSIKSPEYVNDYVQNATQATIEGSGFSLGNSGGWSVLGTDYTQLYTAVRGISQTHSFRLGKHAVGDTAGIYGYVSSDGGATAQSDEGVTGCTIEVNENPGYYHGLVTSTAGTGDRSPVWSAATSGNNWTTDGAFMLNLSKGTLSGNMLSPSQPLSLTTGAGTQATFLNYLPVTPNSLPISTAIGITVLQSGAIPDQQVTADSPIPCTFDVTLCEINGVAGPFTVGSVVTVAGIWYPEQSIITTAIDNGDGTQTLTLNLRNPNASAILFQGGIQGQYISFDANLAFTTTAGSPMRSSYYAFGSLTGSDLIYGLNLNGSVKGNALPQTGSEAAVSDGGTNSGFHLYPGAEVVANPAYGEPNGTLEQNSVHWEINDIVENPHYPVGGGVTARFTKSQISPTNANGGCHGLITSCAGTGFGGVSTSLAQFQNNNPSTYYKGNSGPLVAPHGINLLGTYSNSIYMNAAPEPGGALIVVSAPNNLSEPNNTVGVIGLGWTEAGNLQFTSNVPESTGTWAFSGFVNTPGYYVQNMAGANGTFTSADGKSVTVVGGIITSIS